MAVTQERKRVNAGLQCPECYGVQTFARYDTLTKQNCTSKYECRECGYNWTSDYYKVEEV